MIDYKQGVTTFDTPAGTPVVDAAVWRVRVRINSASPLRTMEIRRRPVTEQCVLTSIDDAA